MRVDCENKDRKKTEIATEIFQCNPKDECHRSDWTCIDYRLKINRFIPSVINQQEKECGSLINLWFCLKLRIFTLSVYTMSTLICMTTEIKLYYKYTFKAPTCYLMSRMTCSIILNALLRVIRLTKIRFSSACPHLVNNKFLIVSCRFCSVDILEVVLHDKAHLQPRFTRITSIFPQLVDFLAI